MRCGMRRYHNSRFQQSFAPWKRLCIQVFLEDESRVIMKDCGVSYVRFFLPLLVAYQLVVDMDLFPKSSKNTSKTDPRCH